MSLFDPHSLYVNRQKKTRKGQILQKKPIPLLRAYTQKDLEEAYRILHAYGIPYGNPPAPPPQPVPQNPLVSVITNDMFCSYTSTWALGYDTDTTMTDKQIMEAFLTTEYGQWLTTTLDLTKVTRYQCVITGKRINYYFDAAGDPVSQPITYQLPVKTRDQMSNFEYTFHMESWATGQPTRYIDKGITSDWSQTPYYIAFYNDLINGNSEINRVTVQTNHSNAYEVSITSDDLPIADLISGNYRHTLIAQSAHTGTQLLQHSTIASITTIANVYFYVEYTE